MRKNDKIADIQVNHIFYIINQIHITILWK
jgi:hypothetical protein